MRSLKFTLPILIAVSIVFSLQCFAKTPAIDAAGNDTLFDASRNRVSEGSEIITGEIPSLETSNMPVDATEVNDPYYGQQWALNAMQLPPYAELAPIIQREVPVAILDAGIDCTQEDLQGKVVTEINFSGSPSSSGIKGHGTHIAGIIAANANNSLGIAGIAPFSRLLNVKVADDTGVVDLNSVIKGIRWAAENGAAVINISIEFPETSHALEEAINYAWEKGAVVVAAASNHSFAPVYPAYYPNCIAVASVNQNGQVGPLLYDKEWVDVAAPGNAIYSTLPGNEYGYKSGTSFATAHVSGLAALLYGIADDRNGNGKINDEVRSAIETTARITPGNDIKTIEADSAISQLLTD